MWLPLPCLRTIVGRNELCGDRQARGTKAVAGRRLESGGTLAEEIRRQIYRTPLQKKKIYRT